MTKFEEEFNYLIELSGKVLIGQVDAEAFEKNRIAFFEKYETEQQQALPVVKDFVAEWYESYSESPESLEFHIYLFCAEFYNSRGNRKDRELTDFEKWFGEDENKPIETLIRMKDGYQVEKPQLFYLKNKLTTSYLALDINTGYYEHWGEEIIPRLPDKQGYKISFTQQEIASMQTGSYEQIEVTE